MKLSHELNRLHVTAPFEQASHDAQLRLGFEFGVFLLLLGSIFFIRIHNLFYRTAFVDEAIYYLVGQDLATGALRQSAIYWMSGSYLYPLLSAFSSTLGGLWGIRLLSAIVSTLAGMMVFLVTKRLFGYNAALWAMLLFGFTGSSLSIGQLATHDALSIGCLTIAFYGLVSAALTKPHKESYYLSMAAISFVLAALLKYVALIYLPLLLSVSVLLYWLQRRSTQWFFIQFFTPVALILGLYVVLNYEALQNFFSGGYSRQPSAWWGVTTWIRDEIGLPSLLALLGGASLIVTMRKQLSVKGFGRSLLVAVITSLLAISLFALPLYHVVTENVRSVVKHTVYALIFISPLAGYIISVAITRFQSPMQQKLCCGRIVGAGLTLLALVYFANYALDRQWVFQHSWPDVSNVVAFLKTQTISPNTRILADGAEVYAYYFNMGDQHHEVWQQTWLRPEDKQADLDAMRANIRDGRYDFVILDWYYQPDVSDQLKATLDAAGYQRVYQETVSIGLNDKTPIHVYQGSRQLAKGD